MSFAVGSAIASAAAKAVDQGIGLYQYNKNLGLAYDQMNMQREFAQNGIRWRVADAKAAGIHPLAALGVQVSSPSGTAFPQQTGTDFASMGQSFERAANAKALAEERALDKSLKEAQIRNVNAQTDAVLAQAEASRAAVARTALPPPMARSNGNTSQGNIADAKPKFMWVLNPDGKRELLPSEEFVSAYEDKPFGLDLLPLFESGWRSFYGKLTDTPLDGYRWSWSNLDWIPDDKSVSSRSWSKNLKGSKAFYNNLRRMDY